ncbi:leucine-rich repeat domain-containing protein [endosymbiont GvMRE of Glomus versiforme]|uniref:leucine-rich repeat domain-containing protein n=1 Tax=endosymbiont GvMRE of Glomus versiforme TaxID=2039283 RepID=UPI000EBDC648|nr:leucine-rich repeat domain-containing protein [endosymbiont GvMRE of Glomus versiforme]RHZ36158.1 HET domain protein [endosymbiont GvMRE of Glomus versiforme]
MTENWESIHKDFKYEYYQKLWIEQGFNYQFTQEWKETLGKGFKPESDWAFCVWLRDEKHLSSHEVQQQGNLEILKTEYQKVWTDTHPDFAEKEYSGSKTNQQHWEEAGLTYQDAQAWILINFGPNDHWVVKDWKYHSFTPQQVQDWKDIGLDEDNYEFAVYLRYKGHQPSPDLNLEKLEKEFHIVQNYLDTIFPKKKREEIAKLDISRKNLTGSLDLNDFVNLERLNCSDNQLSHLYLTNYNKLIEIKCSSNKLKAINFPEQVEKLTILDIRNNNFPKQDLSLFSHLVNLKELKIGNDHRAKTKQGIYNRFSGSLKPLQNLSQLYELDISNTDIDSGLEYLPDGVEDFWCSTKKMPDAKVKAIKEEWEYFNKDLKKCKEFNGSARKWLDEKYSEKKRKEQNELNISYEEINKYEKEENKKIKLKGGLRLKGFTNLKRLNCSNHQLTDLDLSDCYSLIKFKCEGNELKDLNFLKPLAKLEELRVQNNQKLSDKNLNFSIPLINLEELDLSDCSLKGSLKPLENLTKLELLNISNTDIKEGLEYLPESVKNFYCELDYQYGSVEIAKELSKFSEGTNEESGHTKYNLDKWRTDKANHLTASAAPLERLFVIRGNFKQFINKWRKPANDDWFDKLEKFITKQKDQSTDPELNNELSQLQSPKELWRNRWAIYGTQFVGRGAAAVGAFLTFQDQGTIGGGILAVYPFAELIVSNLDERLRGKENKWNEFLTDIDVFLDNYHELLAVTKSIKIGELGKINKAFKNLQEKVDVFLEEHDQSDENGIKNGEIDLEELVVKRIELAQSLDNKESKLWEIVNAMQSLESQVIAYRQGVDIEEVVLDKQKSQLIQKTKTDEYSKQPNVFHNWKDKIKQTTTNWGNWINSKTKGPKAKDAEEISEATQEWFIIFPNLNPQEDLGFILWLRDKKSQEIENFANPRWIKEKIATEELELNELRKEYQEELTSKARIIINIDNEQGSSTASLISSRADLLNRFQQEEIELQNQQQAQIIQLQPFGIPGSSKK